MKNKHIISLILGDWSHDGHRQSETINISSNLDKEEILDAYNVASKQLGFNFINDVCAEYEDNCMSRQTLNILIKHGFKIEDLGISFEYDLKEAKKAFKKDSSENLYLCPEYYTNIFLFIVKLGNSKFKGDILKGKLNPTIDIGGYGLFFG